MNFFQASILGIVEGFTEFLPISSTFHLILTSHFFSIPADEFTKLFEVVIQSGAITAIIFLYLKFLLLNRRIFFQILVSFLPTALIGLALHPVIKNVFFNDFNLMLISSFAVGFLFLLVEFLIKKGYLRLNRQLAKLSFGQAIFVGLCQSLAIIPGVSRSGATILSLLMIGVNRPEAALYSFLLAVPTIISAGVLDLISSPTVLNPSNLMLLSAGFITAFITAYLSVRWLVSFLQKNTLIPFAFYRLILSPLLYLILNP